MDFFQLASFFFILSSRHCGRIAKQQYWWASGCEYIVNHEWIVDRLILAAANRTKKNHGNRTLEPKLTGCFADRTLASYSVNTKHMVHTCMGERYVCVCERALEQHDWINIKIREEEKQRRKSCHAVKSDGGIRRSNVLLFSFVNY